MSLSPGIVAARPLVRVGGQDQPAVSDGLLGLQIVEQAGGWCRCELHLTNWGADGSSSRFLYFDRRLLDFGRDLEVVRQGSRLFLGRITALEGRFGQATAPVLAVLAEDRLQDLRMTRRTRTFNDVTDADVFQRVAQDHGLTADVDLPGPTHRILAQVNQSDLAFLRDRARLAGAELRLDDRRLVAGRRPRGAAPAVQLDYPVNLREFNVLADLAHQRTKIAVAGWDVDGKSAVKSEAEDAAVSAELNGDASGASVLQSAFGARADSLAHQVPFNEREAQAQAEAAFRFRARRFVTGSGVAETDPQLRAGGTVQISGVGPLFSGAYYVSEVRHLFDVVSGMRTRFTVERPGLAQP